MANIICFIILFLGFVFIGVPFSLVALIPPLRKWCQRKRIVRITTIFILGLVPLIIILGPFVRIQAEIDMIFYLAKIRLDYKNDLAEDIELRRQEISSEILFRRLIPPIFRQDCYSSDADVCHYADEVDGNLSLPREWWDYLQRIGMPSISAVTSCILAWFITKQRRTMTEV